MTKILTSRKGIVNSMSIPAVIWKFIKRHQTLLIHSRLVLKHQLEYYKIHPTGLGLREDKLKLRIELIQVLLNRCSPLLGKSEHYEGFTTLSASSRCRKVDSKLVIR